MFYKFENNFLHSPLLSLARLLTSFLMTYFYILYTSIYSCLTKTPTQILWTFIQPELLIASLDMLEAEFDSIVRLHENAMCCLYERTIGTYLINATLMIFALCFIHIMNSSEMAAIYQYLIHLPSASYRKCLLFLYLQTAFFTLEINSNSFSEPANHLRP